MLIPQTEQFIRLAQECKQGAKQRLVSNMSTIIAEPEKVAEQIKKPVDTFVKVSEEFITEGCKSTNPFIQHVSSIIETSPVNTHTVKEIFDNSVDNICQNVKSTQTEIVKETANKIFS